MNWLLSHWPPAGYLHSRRLLSLRACASALSKTAQQNQRLLPLRMQWTRPTIIRNTPVAALQNVLIPSPHSYWYLLCPYLHKEIIKINSWISQSSNIPAGDSGTERL
jgi:hypothetical protein